MMTYDEAKASVAELPQDQYISLRQLASRRLEERLHADGIFDSDIGSSDVSIECHEWRRVCSEQEWQCVLADVRTLTRIDALIAADPANLDRMRKMFATVDD